MKTNEEIIETFRKRAETFLEQIKNQTVFMTETPLCFYVVCCNGLNTIYSTAGDLFDNPSDQVQDDLDSLYDKYFNDLREICGTRKVQ